MIKKVHNYLQSIVFEDSYPKILDVQVDDPLQIEDKNDGIWWEVLTDIRFGVLIQYSKDSEPEWVEDFVPEGFLTDLASVDGIPFIKVDKLTPGNRNFVIHDYGYQLNTLELSQKNWDTIMLIGLKKDDAPSDLAWRRWLGVQVGGRKIWNNYRGRN